MKINEVTGQQPIQFKTGAPLKPLPGPSGTTNAPTGQQQQIIGQDTSKGTVTIGNPQTGTGEIVNQNQIQVNPDGSYSKIAMNQSNAGQPGQTMGSTPNTMQTEEPTAGGDLPAQYINALTQMMQQAREPWEKAQIQARMDAVKSGQVPKSATGGAIPQLPPKEWEANMAKNNPALLTRMLGVFGDKAYSPEYLQQHGVISRGLDYVGLEEADPDLVANPENHDIGGPDGGDKTDALINQLIDKKFTRAQRDPVKSTFNENDPLYKMLTIAGLK
jgi:hypothetical protein